MKQSVSNAKSWPFVQAKELLKNIGGKVPSKGYVLFETGYGPSGLPHIGTFAEVVRTTMVRHAFEAISDIPTKLFVFSDDLDGLRKVPDNVPNKEMLFQNLGKPLTQIPDPFGTHESFGHHNNAQLKRFMDSFGFRYDFKSSSEIYQSGFFDPLLCRVLEHYDGIMNIMLPTVGKERQKTYSPFMPISPTTGRVLQVAVDEIKHDSNSIVYRDENGKLTETSVTGGSVKLQWKPDWAMRWVALDVDYEMYGKDLIPSAALADRISHVLGGRKPCGLAYELFTDENGQKISKSKGNGLSLEDWLRFGPPESLAYYMFQKPTSPKKMYFDVIPKAVDEYLDHAKKMEAQTVAEQVDNPVWHINRVSSFKGEGIGDLTFSVLLNLAANAQTKDKDALWQYISRHIHGLSSLTAPFLDRLAGHAVSYYKEIIQPTNKYRLPNDLERRAFEDLYAALGKMKKGSNAEDIQNEVYAIGKRHPFPELKSWFQGIYEVLFGQKTGPRIGGFIVVFGVENMRRHIKSALDGAFVETHPEKSTQIGATSNPKTCPR